MIAVVAVRIARMMIVIIPMMMILSTPLFAAHHDAPRQFFHTRLAVTIFGAHLLIIAFHTANAPFAGFQGRHRDGVGTHVNRFQFHVANAHGNFGQKVVADLEEAEGSELIQFVG